MAVAITRKDRTAGELRAVAAKCKDAKAALRMLSIAMVLAAIIHRGRIFAWGRAARGVHDFHAQPEFSPQG
ncbi:MAG: hypothetical protein R6V26_03505 [Roseovarius sp.]